MRLAADEWSTGGRLVVEENMDLGRVVVASWWIRSGLVVYAWPISGR